MAPVRALLAAVIDYAGLHPPARLPMPAAVRQYSHYLTLPFAWMLGRFIVPASRLEEFEREAAPLFPQPGSKPWRLSLISAEPLRDAGLLETFNRDHSMACIDSVEIKADNADAIVSASEVFPRNLAVFCEIPVTGELTSLLATIGRLGLHAKVRCGGLGPEAFPSVNQLTVFLQECHAAKVSFKATAGLHHPIRGSYPFSYDADSRTGIMHGFLNLFLASAWVRKGMGLGETAELLEERTASEFRFEADDVAWRQHRLNCSEIVDARENFAHGFGSCSFSDPVAELRTMNLLP